MTSILLFYTAVYFIAIILCIPIGPVNLEIFHTALKKQHVHAVAIAVGAAGGDAFWAMLAFFGISPFASSRYLEAAFFLFTAIITGVLGLLALKDSKIKFVEKKEERITQIIRKRKRWSLLKGLGMVLLNPLGIVSWMICLQFLRKNNIFIPMKINYEIAFFLVVVAGASTYFLLIIFITHKMKRFFNPERTGKIVRGLGYVLLAFSVYFIFYTIKAFFFNNHVAAS